MPEPCLKTTPPLEGSTDVCPTGGKLVIKSWKKSKAKSKSTHVTRFKDERTGFQEMREAKNLTLLWKTNVRSGATLLKHLKLSDQISCVHRSLKQCWIWTWQEVLIQHYLLQQRCRGLTNVFPTPDLYRLQKGRGWEKNPNISSETKPSGEICP